MKHIEKRFFLQYSNGEVNLDTSAFDVFDAKDVSDDTFLKDKKGVIAYMQTANNTVIGGFVHNIDGKNVIFPIPDPTLVYFNYAQLSIKHIREHRKKLLEKISLKEFLSEPAINEIYAFYGVTSSFVIQLFTAMESFMNQIIPDDYQYIIEQNNRTEIYNKRQIQEHLDIKTKLTKVIKDATGKDFFSKQTAAVQHIWNLKEFRDAIIHTKQDNNQLKYDKVIKKLISFKYEEALDSVAKFMNHYKTNYIVECGCGKDF